MKIPPPIDLLVKKVRKPLATVKHAFFYWRLLNASAHEKAELLRNKFFYLGKNVELYTTHIGTEPYLISIHDNVTCATGVRFLNHDVSCFNMARVVGVEKTAVDKVGSIVLYENAFVGAYSILMPNTSVGKNSVVAAGSVVTKHIPDGEVWGGCPAKYIMKTSDYATKVVRVSKEYPWMNNKEEISVNMLIKSRQDFFFKMN